MYPSPSVPTLSEIFQGFLLPPFFFPQLHQTFQTITMPRKSATKASKALADPDYDLSELLSQTTPSTKQTKVNTKKRAAKAPPAEASARKAKKAKTGKEPATKIKNVGSSVFDDEEWEGSQGR